MRVKCLAESVSDLAVTVQCVVPVHGSGRTFDVPPIHVNRTRTAEDEASSAGVIRFAEGAPRIIGEGGFAGPCIVLPPSEQPNRDVS